MIACFDVFYHPIGATSAAVTISGWDQPTPDAQFKIEIAEVHEYETGKFYKRELTPILEVIKEFPNPIRYFVIDAYCHLDDQRAPGLGAYLHQELPPEAIVIGVAKNRFRDTKHAVELLRGESVRPLFVTAIGMEYQAAADLIKSMDGEFRFPTILKSVDQLSRSTPLDE